MNAIPSWIENPAKWNECYLGGVPLPGLASVPNLGCGPRIDRQKRRSREGAKFKDNGLEPAKFTIELWMNASLWPQWCVVLPKIYSLKPSNPREPKEIIHPLPNSMGITSVYVLKVKPGMPSPGRGFKVSIEVEQWFEELKEAKPKNQVNRAVPDKRFDRGVTGLGSHGTLVQGPPTGIEAIEQGIYQSNQSFDRLRHEI